MIILYSSSPDIYKYNFSGELTSVQIHLDNNKWFPRSAKYAIKRN